MFIVVHRRSHCTLRELSCSGHLDEEEEEEGDNDEEEYDEEEKEKNNATAIGGIVALFVIKPLN